jgi:hypothetical protein
MPPTGFGRTACAVNAGFFGLPWQADDLESADRGLPLQREQMTVPLEQARCQWPVWGLRFSVTPCGDRRSWSPQRADRI